MNGEETVFVCPFVMSSKVLDEFPLTY